MSKSSTQVVIWDFPTRVFHWSLVISFALAWISYDDDRYLAAHVYAGYVFFALLLFRLIWGVIGTHYSRFRTFAYSWTSVSAYLKALLTGQAMRHIGHNPIGGWAIFALLMLGMLISISGLLVMAGEEGHGPLSGLVSYNIGIFSGEIHEILSWAMLGFVGVHVSGVIVESFIHKENLILSMLSGHKEGVPTSSGVQKHHFMGTVLLIGIIISGLLYFRGYLIETAENRYQPYTGPQLPDNALWRESCGECHHAFHPSLMPKRSWQKTFDMQHEHFDEDLDFDETDYEELLAFHLDNAAESQLTEPARKILYYTEADKTPLRITDTHYWVMKHEDIDDAYWKHEKVSGKWNCQACHLDAEQNTYEDSSMRLPNLNADQANPSKTP